MEKKIQNSIQFVLVLIRDLVVNKCMYASLKFLSFFFFKHHMIFFFSCFASKRWIDLGGKM